MLIGMNDRMDTCIDENHARSTFIVTTDEC